MKNASENKQWRPPKIIHFPSDLSGVRIHNGKEEVKVLCDDNEYHWVDLARYHKSVDE